MLDFAESEFRLNSLENGKTVRDHFITAWQVTGNRPKQLDQPVLSFLVTHIWGWFLDLNRVRGTNGFGPSPISYRDITDWSRLKCIVLMVWEINALCLLDSMYISISNKSTK